VSFPFDASSKFFLSLSLKDWLVLIGRPTDADVAELDSDLSTISAAADKLIRVNGPDPSIEHIEVQSSRDVNVPIRMCRYGVLALYETHIPVSSTLILLRPEADGMELTGIFEAKSRNGMPYLQYRYQVIRLWEIPAQFFLDAGIGVLPLAPLGKINLEQLPDLMRQVRFRVERLVSPTNWEEYWTGIGVLMGLKFEPNQVHELLKGIADMIDLRDSSIVQMYLKEGREEGVAIGLERGLERGAVDEARRILLKLLSRRFGQIDPKVQSMVDSTADLATLERLLDRIVDVASPESLFDSGHD
jgi:predicted transposase YdaD